MLHIFINKIIERFFNKINMNTNTFIIVVVTSVYL